MNDELSWHSVTAQQTIDELLDISGDFHDAFTAASVWQGAESLDSGGNLKLCGYGTLYLTIISQLQEVPALELRFHKVRAFRYDYELDSDPAVEFANGSIRARFLEWEIQAEAFDYRKSLGSLEPPNVEDPLRRTKDGGPNLL